MNCHHGKLILFAGLKLNHSIQFEYIGLKIKLLDQVPYIHKLVSSNC